MRLACFQWKKERTQPTVAARTGFGRGPALVGAMATLVFCCAAVPTRAEPFAWVAGPAQPANRVSQDLELGLRARKALLQDDALAGQLFGISVRNRTATLWGIVSSPSVARHAEACVRNLPGVTAVRNDLTINPSSERQPDSLNLPRPPQLPGVQPVQGALMHRAGEAAPTTRQESSWRPAGRSQRQTVPELADRVAEHGSMPAKPLRESLPGFPSWDSTRIPGQSALRTQPLPRMEPEERTPVMPALTLPPASPASASTRVALPIVGAGSPTKSTLLQAVDALRLADDRFRGLRAEVRGETVYLRGTVFRWEHLFELARSVARLPGVKQVRFEEVRAEIAP